MDIKYDIEFFSDWHCGAGLSAGVDTDLLVIKDKNGLPFIPGKTLKGLIREALEDLSRFSGKSTDILKLLGNEADYTRDGETATMGCCFFKNAELEPVLQEKIILNKLQAHLYHSIAFTAIAPDGTAAKQTLRKMQVTVPCTLKGEILDVPESDYFVFCNALQYIRRLGQNRNRGLGRCSISIIS